MYSYSVKTSVSDPLNKGFPITDSSFPIFSLNFSLVELELERGCPGMLLSVGQWKDNCR